MAPTLTQAMNELKKLQAMHERRPGIGRHELSEVELARTISFVINQAAWGRATPAQTRQAQQIHFALYETPEINLSMFGPKEFEPIVTLEGGRPNQLAPVSSTDPHGPVDPRALYLDDDGKAPAARPQHHDPRHGGKEQR